MNKRRVTSLLFGIILVMASASMMTRCGSPSDSGSNKGGGRTVQGSASSAQF